MVRPWVILVVDRSNGLVLGHEMLEETPVAGAVVGYLVASVATPVGW